MGSISPPKPRPQPRLPYAADLAKTVLKTLPIKLPTPSPNSTIPDVQDLDIEAITAPIFAALSSQDTSTSNTIATYLTEDSIWRDILSLTGSIRTFYSAESITKAYTDCNIIRKATNFKLAGGPPGSQARIMQIHGRDEDPRVQTGDLTWWLDVSFDFMIEGVPRGGGKGFLSLVPDVEKDGTAGWKVWMLRTVLEGLEGVPDVDRLEPVADQTPKVHNGDNGINGHEVVASATTDDISSEVDVLVIGAGQAGLGMAGRLQALNLSWVVVDKNEKIGDNWLSRYETAKLHTAREYNHMPFDRTFPGDGTYGEWLSKYELARGYNDWVDKFGLRENMWMGTEVVYASWDEKTQSWDVKIRNAKSGEERMVKCKHVVLASGAGGQVPLMPNYPGQELFKGKALHSVQYGSAKAWAGKKGLVIGTANTAHDIAEDMLDNGMSSVTMVQKSTTYVLPTEYFKRITDFTYTPSIPIEVADRAGYTMPYGVTRLVSRRTLHGMARQEPERFDNLGRVGYNVERYGDIMWHICERLGGHYMDVGACKRIANGEINVKSGTLPVGYTESGLMLSDGSELEADVVVFSTGFVGTVKHQLTDLFGPEVAAQADEFWGLDEEGELNGVYKKIGQPGLWYTGGTIGHARYFSRHIALQIKAELMGVGIPIYEKDSRTKTTQC